MIRQQKTVFLQILQFCVILQARVFKLKANMIKYVEHISRKSIQS